MELKNLRKIRGYSAEDILEAIKRTNIQYKVLDKKSPNNFRNPVIILERKDREALVEQIGYGRGNHFKEFYYAEYGMLPDFDLSQLHGKIIFRHGSLVESTEIRYRN